MVLLQAEGVKRRKGEKRGDMRLETHWWKGTFPGGGKDILGIGLPRPSVFCTACCSRFPLLFRMLACMTTCTRMNRHSDNVIH